MGKGGVLRDPLRKNSVTSEFKRRFSETFPKVAEVIRQHKRKDYRFLSRLLQNYESTVIINRVCRRLMNEHPAAPIYTIHDSILTTSPWIRPMWSGSFGRSSQSSGFHQASTSSYTEGPPRRPEHAPG